MSAREVKIGENNYRIAPFRAYKAILAGRIVARVSDQITLVIDSLADYVAQYEQKHTVRMTRDMAEMRAAEEPAYRVLIDGVLSQQPYLELPQSPSFEEQILAVFSKVFEFAETEAKQLLALVVIPNSELREARREDSELEVLSELGDRLLDEAELGELVELAVAVNEVVRDQLTPHREALGKLRALYRRAETRVEEAVEKEATPDSTPRSQESSTGSPPPTGGTTSEPSSAPAGAR